MQNPQILSQRQTGRVALHAILGSNCLGSGHCGRSNIGHLREGSLTRTCARSNTDMKASVPPWNSPGTVSTHQATVLAVSNDIQSDDMNDGPWRRARSRNIPRLVFVRSANAGDADPQQKAELFTTTITFRKHKVNTPSLSQKG